MESDQVLESFDNLISDLEKFLPVLNQKGAQFIEGQNYEEAKEIILKAQKVLTLMDQVMKLREDWLGMGFSSNALPTEIQEERKEITREFLNMLRSEPHINNQTIKKPILQALINLGGSAKRKDLLAEIESLIEGELTETDLKTIPSNEKLAVWKSIAIHTLQNLKNENLVSNNEGKGNWQITKEGKEFLEEKY